MPHIKNALIRYRIIDRLLRNKYKTYPSKQEMREACEDALYGTSHGDNICDSTIEKDMFAMKMDHDAPIKYSRKNEGYFYENPDFSINDIPLSEDELSSIRFAVNTLQQFREVPFFQQFGNAIDKIVDRVAMGSDQESDVNQFVSFESAKSMGGNQFLPDLLSAIRAKTLVDFQYESFISGISKPRQCLPLFLKEYRNRWYLISFDLSKEDIITYALDRISDLVCSSTVYVVPESFDAVSYFQDTIGITAFKGKPEKIKFEADKVAARYINSQAFHHSQKIEKQTSASTVFTLKILISEELIRTILSYGGEIEVLAPESLRQTIRLRAKQLASLYK